MSQFLICIKKGKTIESRKLHATKTANDCHNRTSKTPGSYISWISSPPRSLLPPLFEGSQQSPSGREFAPLYYRWEFIIMGRKGKTFSLSHFKDLLGLCYESSCLFVWSPGHFWQFVSPGDLRNCFRGSLRCVAGISALRFQELFLADCFRDYF